MGRELACRRRSGRSSARRSYEDTSVVSRQGRVGRSLTTRSQRGIGRMWRRSFLVIGRQRLHGSRRLLRHWRKDQYQRRAALCLSMAGTHIKPAKKTNSKYILCGHEMRSFTTIGMGNPSIMASATRSRPPIAKVSLP